MLIFSKLFRRYFSKGSRRASLGGFTLIEMVVVSAIMLVITTFVLFQQAKFDSVTLLRSLTYNVALSVRQAQVYGTSVRESAPGSGIFGKGYGIHFAASLPCTGGAWTCYVIFSDNNGNGAYDTGEALPTFTLGRGYAVSRLCATIAGGVTQHCTPAVDRLTIFFRRPNPEACFSTNQAGSCAVGAAAAYSAAYIQLTSLGGTDTRSVKVSSTGQIDVCTPNLADLTQC